MSRSRYYARMRRHALARPMHRKWWWRGVGEPVPVALARLRRAEARANRWRATMVVVPSPENVEEPPPGKHRRPPTLAMELSGEAPCPDCWAPENVEEGAC